MNKLYDIDDLIAKVLANEATHNEAQDLQERLAGSAELRTYFEQMRHLWDASETALGDLDVNTDAAWANVQARIHAPKTTAKPLTISWLQSPHLLRWAAVGVVLIVASLWFFNSLEKNTPLSIKTQNVAIEQKMEDGSEVQVSEQSKLTATFSAKERRVQLEGKAFFKVAPDVTKPFIIETQSPEVQVVGTQFTVDDRSQAGKVIVLVNEGRVLLRGGYEEKLLTAGMKGEYDVSTKRIFVFESAPEILPSLNFKGRLMKQVAADLSRYFNKTVVIGSPEIENCPQTSDFTGDSLEDIMKILGVDYSIERTEKGYRILGDGCY